MPPTWIALLNKVQSESDIQEGATKDAWIITSTFKLTPEQRTLLGMTPVPTDEKDEGPVEPEPVEPDPVTPKNPKRALDFGSLRRKPKSNRSKPTAAKSIAARAVRAKAVSKQRRAAQRNRLLKGESFASPMADRLRSNSNNPEPEPLVDAPTYLGRDSFRR